MSYTKADLDTLDTAIKEWLASPDLKKKTIEYEISSPITYFSIEELTKFRDWLKSVLLDETVIEIDKPETTVKPSQWIPFIFRREC